MQARKGLGWKTIVGGIAFGLVVIAEARGWLDPQAANTLKGLLIPWLAYGVRDGIRKAGEP